jgi:hypothetical protein
VPGRGGSVAAARGAAAAAAARLADAYTAQHAVLGVEPDPTVRALQERTEALGENAFAEAWAEGHVRTVKEAVVEAGTILAWPGPSRPVLSAFPV